MRDNNNPCRNCEKKGCGVYHDICPEYQAFRNEQKKDYEKRRQLLQARHDLNYIDHVHFMRLRKNKRK